jgi:YVTN family beta-propeller protein
MGDGNADGHLDIRILGSMEVRRGGQLLPLGGHRQQAVLACLAVSRGLAAPTDRIADAIWGESPPPGYLTTLQTYVYRLREVLEPDRPKGAPAQVLVTAGNGYRLAIPVESVDARRFEELVLQGQRLLATNPERASSLLGEALALWRDTPLAEFADLQPVSLEATRLDELRQSALEGWAQAELTLGYHARLAPELGRWVAAFPLREGLQGHRMLALYRDGRQAEALAAYQQLRETLEGELGIEPSSSLRQLNAQILHHDPRLDWRPLHPTDRNGWPSTVPAAAQPASPEPPPVPATPEHRRRWPRWVAVVGVFVVAAGLLGYGAIRLSHADDVVSVPPNTVAMLSVHGRDGDAIPVSGADVALASGAGSLWAVDEIDNAVRRLDAKSRQVIQTIRDVGGSPQSVAVSGNDVWVAGFDQSVVKRINAATNSVVATISVGAGPAAVVAADKEVWVANSGDNTVQRIDPATDEPGPPVPVGTSPDGLALDGTNLWVANARDATVTILDTTSRERVAADVPVGDGPRGLTVTTSDVWVANELDQTVTRVDRASHKAVPIRVEDGPSSVVLADGYAWVNNAYSDSISRIDTADNAVSRIALGSAPRALTVVDGRVWVATGSFGNVEHRGGTLTYTNIANQLGPTLDPAVAYNPPNLSLLRPVYDGLVAFRVNSRVAPRVLVPDLATTIPRPTDGGRTYVFTIRSGIRYSTGAEITATDFVRGLRRAVIARANPNFFRKVVGAAECFAHPPLPGEGDPSGACALAGGVSADDGNRRLAIHLSEPDPYFLYELAYFVVPTPPGMPLTDVGVHATIPGTGAYVLSAVAPDRSFTLSRNAYFHQWSFAAQPYGYPDQIRFQVAPTRDDVVADVLAGRADVAHISHEQRAALAGHDELARDYSIFQTNLAYLNSAIPPFDNLKARQAINYAVDRRTLVSLFGGGPSAADVSCQMLPVGFPAYRPYCPYQTGPPNGTYQGPDIDQAKKLVTESKTGDIPIVVRAFPYGLDPFPAYLAEVLRSIGYAHVTVADMPKGLPDDDPAYAGYQIFTQNGWGADYPDPSTFYDFFFSCQTPNWNRYCNPDIEAIAVKAKALTDTDPVQSLARWRDVDHLLTDAAAPLTLGDEHAAQLFSTRVGNIQITPGLGVVLSQCWVQ